MAFKWFVDFLAHTLREWPKHATRAVVSHLAAGGLVVKFYDGDKFVVQDVIPCGSVPSGLKHGESCTYKEYFRVAIPAPPAEDNQTRRMGAGQRNGGRILAELLAKNLDAWPNFATRAQASHLTVAGVAVNFYDRDKFVSRRDVEAPGGYGEIKYGDSCTYTEYLQVPAPSPAEDNQTRRMGAGQRNGSRILARALSSWPDYATRAVVSRQDPETEAMVVNFYDGSMFVQKMLAVGALREGDSVTRDEWLAWSPDRTPRVPPVPGVSEQFAPPVPPEQKFEATIMHGQGYGLLADVLGRAFEQSATGKGKDRHTTHDGQPFEDQPICELQRLYGSGYAYGQVGKKMEEAQRLPRDQAVAELLGGIVYLAAAVIVLEEDSH